MTKKRRKAEPMRSMTVRLTQEDYAMLCELRLVAHLSSDGAAVRALIRMHGEHAGPALRRARRDPAHKERLQALVDHRQIDMFPGDTA